jgi:DNA-3-methyladenine glycosylase I
MPPLVQLTKGSDGKNRCSWCGTDPLYLAYHDAEWGIPLTDDVRLFEKICLEGFQSGLSWITILKKRAAFRRAFLGFDYGAIAKWTEKDVDRLVLDAGIVRHRKKIESVLNNARQALLLIEEFGSLAHFFWKWAQDRPFAGIVASTDASGELSRQLKKRGFSFVGPTTAYAFMQSVGLVNDHFPGCHRQRTASELQRKVMATFS